jgi:hypothetical protein
MLQVVGDSVMMSTFFNPRDSFLKWLKKHADGRIVWDVGCGNGVFLKRMHAAGVKVIGVEPEPDHSGIWRDITLLSSFFPQKAEECLTLHKAKDALILFCRPCHDGFVNRTLPLLDASSEILWISLARQLAKRFAKRQNEEIESAGNHRRRNRVSGLPVK